MPELQCPSCQSMIYYGDYSSLSVCHCGQQLREEAAPVLGTANGQMIQLSSTDRPFGTVLIGQTGFGKTSLMEHLITTDTGRTTSFVFDPHGELSERLLRFNDRMGRNNTIICEISDNNSYGFNPLEMHNPGDPLEESRIIDSLMQVFRKHWGDNPAFGIGSRAEWVLSHSFRTILANPGYTLAEIPLLFSDKAFRDKLVRNIQNPETMQFWGWFRRLESTPRTADQWQLVESTLTRLSQFLSNSWLYRVLYQAKGTIKFPELIKHGITYIFPLPIGVLGEEPASLLGSLLLGNLATTLFGRTKENDFFSRVHIYIDEYARFSIPLISQLWTQARKFNCGMTATLQSLSQVKDEENRAAILQAGNLISFQLIGSDADIIAKQLPLPDPVSLMKPEPILLHSQTPVEDIWHKGHPNKEVMEARKYYFRFVEMLERYPQDDYHWLDPTSLYTAHPDWQKFPDWDMYRSSAAMLKQGLSLLNQYFIDWMNHKYSLHTEASPEEINLVLKVVECCSGFLGMRPVMLPFIEENNWQILLKRIEEHIQRQAEQHLEDRDRYAAYHPGLTVWHGDSYREYLESQGVFDPLPVDKFSNRFHPKELPLLREILSHDAGISLTEIDKLIQWQVKPLNEYEQDALTGLVKTMLNLWTQPEVAMQPIAEQAKGQYIAYMTISTMSLLLHMNLGDYAIQAEELTRKYPAEHQLASERAAWEVNQLSGLVAFGCKYCGYILEKEPLFDTSHVYKEVEWNRRSYADLREELMTKLVSLPPYQAIVHLARQSGELPDQIRTPQPLPMSNDGGEEAMAVRENSQYVFGHPWQEVVKDITNRQNLPPAKPQI